MPRRNNRRNTLDSLPIPYLSGMDSAIEPLIPPSTVDSETAVHEGFLYLVRTLIGSEDALKELKAQFGRRYINNVNGRLAVPLTPIKSRISGNEGWDTLSNIGARLAKQHPGPFDAKIKPAEHVKQGDLFSVRARFSDFAVDRTLCSELYIAGSSLRSRGYKAETIPAAVSIANVYSLDNARRVVAAFDDLFSGVVRLDNPTVAEFNRRDFIPPK